MPYKVQPGDSWARIAGKLFGDQRMLGELQRANGGVGGLKPGMMLNVPKKKKNPLVTDADLAGRGGFIQQDGGATPSTSAAEVSSAAPEEVSSAAQPHPDPGLAPRRASSVAQPGHGGVPHPAATELTPHPLGPPLPVQINQQSKQPSLPAHPLGPPLPAAVAQRPAGLPPYPLGPLSGTLKGGPKSPGFVSGTAAGQDAGLVKTAADLLGGIKGGGLTRGQVADIARLNALAIAHGQFPNRLPPWVRDAMGMSPELWASLYYTDYPYSLRAFSSALAPAGRPGFRSLHSGGGGHGGGGGGGGGRPMASGSLALGLVNWRI